MIWKSALDISFFFIHLFLPVAMSNKIYIRNPFLPWLVWLSGLSSSLWTKGSPGQFPVRAYVLIAGQVPSREHTRGNHSMMFPSLSFSFPSPLSKKINKWNLFLKKNPFFLKLDCLSSECCHMSFYIFWISNPCPTYHWQKCFPIWLDPFSLWWGFL